MRKMLATVVLGWSFLTAGFVPQRTPGAGFTPSPAQFFFARLEDCLAAHAAFRQAGFVTLPDNRGSLSCWAGPEAGTIFPPD